MASPLLVKSAAAPDSAGVVLDLTPARAGWSYISFRVWRLADAQRVRDRAAGEELGLVVLSGRVDIRSTAGDWLDFGGRAGVFAGKPHALYLPPGTEFELTARGPCEVARCGAMAERGVAAYAIAPEAIKEEVRGEGTALRHIRHLLEIDRPAEHLLLVEVITPAGHWSSYPPHKHDTDDPPHESRLEETYYHRLQPERGFGFQRVYTPDGSLDEAIAVQDGDVVMVPKGYHPVAAAPGYESYYLNVMAGPTRLWRFRDDPDHAWVAKSWNPYEGK